MARAARQDIEQVKTRERILAAARELFAEQGYTAASISKIAKRADVLAGSIYWAFESKEKLFAEVLTEASEQWKRRYLPAANDRRTSVATLREDMLTMAAGFVEGPDFLRLLMVVATEHQASSPEIRDAAVAVRRIWRDAIERALIEDLAGHDPVEVQALVTRISRLVLQLLDGVFMSLQIEQTELTAHALFADAADIVQRELQFGIGKLRRAG